MNAKRQTSIDQQIKQEWEALTRDNSFTHISYEDYKEARRAALDGSFKALEDEYGTEEALEIMSKRTKRPTDSQPTKTKVS